MAIELINHHEILQSPKYLDSLAQLDEMYFPWPWKTEQITDFCKKDDSLVIGLVAQEKLSAFLLGQIDMSLQQFHLYKLLTHPNSRKCGFAQELFRFASLKLAERGVSKIYLEVGCSNHAAISFYEKWGLEVIHRARKFYSDGSDANIMLGNVNHNLFD